MRITRRRRTAVSLALAALLATVNLACGIPEENEPRAVAPERIPDQLETAPPSVPSSLEEVGQMEPIYMITTDEEGETRLIAYPVPFENPTTRNLVAQLLTDAANPVAEGIDTRVPDDLAVIDADGEDGVTVSDDLVRIRLNDELQNLQGPTQRQAIAQIVWTATQVGGIERVQLVDVDDETIPVNTDDGTKDVVTRNDFADLAPRGS